MSAAASERPAEGTPGRAWVSLAAALALLALARGALVASLADVFYYGEELAKGAAGKALRDGLDVPHARLAYHAYEGGGFVFSHLDALAFALVGENLLALKLVALSWTAATLTAGWLCVRRAFGARAAAVFGVLFALAPATFQKTSLLALGIHFEALLFVGLAFGLLVRAAVDGARGPGTWAALGAALGFGTYFSYQVALLTAFAAGVLLVRCRAACFGRPGAAALGGFVLGLAPLFWMVAQVGGDVLDIHGRGLFAGGEGKLARHATMVRSLFAGRGALESAWVALLLLAPIAAWGGLVRRVGPSRVRASAWLVGAYLAFFLGVYALSDFAVGPVYHYFRLDRLSQVWWLGTVLLSAGLARGLASPRAVLRRAAWAATVLVALAGARDLVRTARAGVGGSWSANLARLAHTPGYAYGAYLAHVQSRLEGTPAERMGAMLGFDDPFPARLRAEVGAVFLARHAKSLAEARDLAREVAGEDWRDLFLGAGPLWWSLHTLDSGARLAALEEAPEDLRAVLAEAQGRSGESQHVTRAVLEREIARAVELGAPPAWLRGLGWRAHDVRGAGGLPGLARPVPPAFALDHAAARAFLESRPAAVRVHLLEGWERALRERRLP